MGAYSNPAKPVRNPEFGRADATTSRNINADQGASTSSWSPAGTLPRFKAFVNAEGLFHLSQTKVFQAERFLKFECTGLGVRAQG